MSRSQSQGSTNMCKPLTPQHAHLSLILRCYTFHVNFCISQSRDDIVPMFLVLQIHVSGIKCNRTEKMEDPWLEWYAVKTISVKYYIIPSRTNFYWVHLPYSQHTLPESKEISCFRSMTMWHLHELEKIKANSCFLLLPELQPSSQQDVHTCKIQFEDPKISNINISTIKIKDTK